MQCKWEKGIFCLGFVGVGHAVHADAVGIVGGTDMGAYVELLTDLNGGLLPVSGLPDMGESWIGKVDINNSGLSLIGGRNDSAAYAAFVQSDGTVSPITLSISTGVVFDLGK